jgi:hypothetical protein
MLTRAIALRFGYVESNRLDWFVFQAKVPCLTKKDAIHSLTEYLFRKFDPVSNRPHKKCCVATAKKDKDAEFCSKCGKGLKRYFPVEEWMEWLDTLSRGVIDDYGYGDEPENPNVWDPSQFGFGIPDKEMLVVNEEAAEILTIALFEIHPELKEIADDPPAETPENWIWRDYQKLLDESDFKHVEYSVTFNEGEGASAVQKQGVDHVWFRYNGKDTEGNETFKVTCVWTHDGTLIDDECNAGHLIGADSFNDGGGRS